MKRSEREKKQTLPTTLFLGRYIRYCSEDEAKINFQDVLRAFIVLLGDIVQASYLGNKETQVHRISISFLYILLPNKITFISKILLLHSLMVSF